MHLKLLFILLVCVSSKEWTAEAARDQFLRQGKQSPFILADEAYLSPAYCQKLQESLKGNFPGISIYLMMLERISPQYKDAKTGLIDTEEFFKSFSKLLKNDRHNIKNSIYVIFSVKDRKFGTHFDKRNTFGKDKLKLLDAVETIRPLLRQQKYEEAVTSLFTKIKPVLYSLSETHSKGLDEKSISDVFSSLEKAQKRESTSTSNHSAVLFSSIPKSEAPLSPAKVEKLLSKIDLIQIEASFSSKNAFPGLKTSKKPDRRDSLSSEDFTLILVSISIVFILIFIAICHTICAKSARTLAERPADLRGYSEQTDTPLRPEVIFHPSNSFPTSFKLECGHTFDIYRKNEVFEKNECPLCARRIFQNDLKRSSLTNNIASETWDYPIIIDAVDNSSNNPPVEETIAPKITKALPIPESYDVGAFIGKLAFKSALKLATTVITGDSGGDVEFDTIKGDW